MNKKDTKQKVQALFKDWPDREKFKDVTDASFNFHGWLQQTHASLFVSGGFPPGSTYQTVKGWCQEWDNSRGEIERLRSK